MGGSIFVSLILLTFPTIIASQVPKGLPAADPNHEAAGGGGAGEAHGAAVQCRYSADADEPPRRTNQDGLDFQLYLH